MFREPRDLDRETAILRWAIRDLTIRLRNKGFTFREIGVAFGVSRQRALQLYQEGTQMPSNNRVAAMAQKSLMEYICEAIDEALPRGYERTGREIYLLGFERYETAHFEREMKRARRELDATMPLFGPLEKRIPNTE